jgi:uncharacterized protein (TIGR03435 family)
MIRLKDHAASCRESLSPVIRAVVGAALAMTALCAAFGQSATDSPAFDVASVKPNRTGANGGSLSRSGGRIVFDNASLKECIAFAYSIATGRDYALSGPAWLDSEKFDIAATFPPATSRDRLREMLRTLLAERFGVKTHRESRRLKAYALVVGKRGPRLKEAGNGGDDSFIFGEGRVTARAISMASFADRLSGPVFKLERPVIDMTGIKGSYDLTLEWAPDGMSVDGRPGASIFTALQEQLGLKLEVRETTIGILVVDHADRIPTGN